MPPPAVTTSVAPRGPVFVGKNATEKTMPLAGLSEVGKKLSVMNYPGLAPARVIDSIGSHSLPVLRISIELQ